MNQNEANLARKESLHTSLSLLSKGPLCASNGKTRKGQSGALTRSHSSLVGT
ncbi:hypothetical protein FOWG_07695 [Fusarium oxysporum f. sp. lycopersici MN25]|nr:hypothetical protein FOWG_07695 [Fusarium oxysporum f. sp. lycopersici MN25]